MFKVTGYIPGCRKYRLHIVLKTGEMRYTIFRVLTQAEFNSEAKRIIRDRGFWEEVDRVYATRIDCKPVPGRARRAA